MLKRAIFIIVILAVVVVFVYVILATISQPIPNHAFFSGPKIRVIAHRGGAGLAPENTMVAFENAAALGVDVLEMDIHSTSDNVLVVIHDDTVDRTTNGTGFVHNFTLAELKQLDAGYHWTNDEGQTFPYRGQGVTIPTLEEVFNAFPDIRMNIEIKQSEPSINDMFCHLLRDYGQETNVLAGSFDTATNNDFHNVCPEVAIPTAEAEIRLFVVLNWIYAAGAFQPKAEAFEVPEYSGNIRVVDERFIESAHKHNMVVWVWTVNEVEDMQRLLNMGADAIITDFPDRLVEHN